jgi:hypothetical protein
MDYSAFLPFAQQLDAKQGSPRSKFFFAGL